LVRLDLPTGRAGPIAGTGVAQGRLQVSPGARGGIVLTTITQQNDILGVDLD